MRTCLHRFAIMVAAVSMFVTLAGCGQADQPDVPHRKASDGGFTVGLLFPDNQATRYENFDGPLIEKKIAELCGACSVVDANAQGDVSTQRRQVDTMLVNGVDVLVLDRVDGPSLRRSVQKARDAGVPVIAYDRLADGPVSGYVSFNDYAVGRIQGEALLRGMGRRASGDRIVWLDATVPSSAWSTPRVEGALSVLKGKVDIAEEYTIGSLNEQDSYVAMSAAVVSLGPENVDGVYALNDVIAAGAIAALKNAHVTALPPVVGQDAELSAVQRIVKGEQYMTAYKPYGLQANAAAEMAVALGRGEKPHGISETTVGNATDKGIPAVLLEPVPVTANSIKNTVVKDGVYTVKQICTPKLAEACRKAGLL
ncbi:sugar ABC transporter substrate-binding protein [Streptomyces xantholiticus]|uniref:Substrate-binding domain-containing protein n=1 Tax=Streptomyces xantholiticus TaxID=68285 RepID=A0ABV1V0C6_9ACTN